MLQLRTFQHSYHGGARGEGKEQEIENLFEQIMKEHFLNLVREIDMQVQEAQTVPNKMDAKRPTPRHTIINMPKVKDKENLKSSQEKSSTLPTKEFPLRLSADFSKETLQARRDWQEVFKVMKSKDLQPR